MSQTYNDNCFQGDHVAQTDMGVIENNFAALKSSFSGTSAPSDTVGGMPWHRSTARLVRNYADSSWLANLLGDATQKMWVYRNDVCEGWLVDSSVTDRVLSIKGGSNAYNVNGGNTGGTWTQPNHTHSDTHTHTIAHTHTNNHTHPSRSVSLSYPGSNVTFYDSARTGNTGGSSAANSGARSAANTGNGATAATYRPAAAVGTLQYPDMTLS